MSRTLTSTSTASDTSAGSGKQGPVRLLILALLAAIFLFDLFIPLGVATGVPYIAPVLLAHWLPNRRAIVFVACIATVLLGAGYLLSPPGTSPWIVLSNRILSVAAIWIVAVMGFQRKRLDDRLATSERVSRAILSSTAEGILLVDDKGVIRRANESATRIFGYEQEDLVGRPLGSLVVTGPGSETSEDFSRVRAELAEIHDTTIICQNDSRLSVETQIVPVEVDASTWYTVTARDASRRRLLDRDVLHTLERERREIGYGLHENLGQALTGLQLISKTLADRLKARELPEAEIALELAERLSETDALALDLFSGLAPIDARGGFAAAIRQAVSEAAQQAGVKYTVTEHHASHEQKSHQLDALYRIGIELTQTALEHGRPERVKVDIGVPGHPLALTLTGVYIDDEKGWTQAMERLKYRAKTVGGRLRQERLMSNELRLVIEILDEH